MNVDPRPRRLLAVQSSGRALLNRGSPPMAATWLRLGEPDEDD